MHQTLILDNNKITEFVKIAKATRGFPLGIESTTETILTHLNLSEQSNR